jgi:hypothetical protein
MESASAEPFAPWRIEVDRVRARASRRAERPVDRTGGTGRRANDPMSAVGYDRADRPVTAVGTEGDGRAGPRPGGLRLRSIRVGGSDAGSLHPSYALVKWGETRISRLESGIGP